MTAEAVDPWAPWEAGWKTYLEDRMVSEAASTKFDHAILETDCPGCGKHVGAMIVDGPDPAFVDLICPLCDHGEAVTWTERVS